MTSSTLATVGIVTALHVYSSVDRKYVAWSRALINWQNHSHWKTLVSALLRIISKANELGLLDVLPRRARNNAELKLVNVKEPYELRDNEVLIGLRGEKYVYISGKTSRRVTEDEIKRIIMRALELKRKGFVISKVILISLTDIEPSARQWMTAARIHNIVFDHVKIGDDVGILGRILFLANNIDTPQELERLGLNPKEEISYVVSALLELR